MDEVEEEEDEVEEAIGEVEEEDEVEEAMKEVEKNVGKKTEKCDVNIFCARRV